MIITDSKDTIQRLTYQIPLDLKHQEIKKMQCPGDYKGAFEVQCYDGEIKIVSIGVPCAKNCADMTPIK